MRFQCQRIEQETAIQFGFADINTKGEHGHISIKRVKPTSTLALYIQGHARWRPLEYRSVFGGMRAVAGHYLQTKVQPSGAHDALCHGRCHVSYTRQK